MERHHFYRLVEEAIDSLHDEFRKRVRNVAILVEDVPPDQPPSRPGRPKKLAPRRLLLGLFHGTPMTKKSVFELPTGPDYIVLYQKNIEAVCRNDDEVREQVRRTVIHELAARGASRSPIGLPQIGYRRIELAALSQ